MVGKVISLNISRMNTQKNAPVAAPGWKSKIQRDSDLPRHRPVEKITTSTVSSIKVWSHGMRVRELPKSNQTIHVLYYKCIQILQIHLVKSSSISKYDGSVPMLWSCPSSLANSRSNSRIKGTGNKWFLCSKGANSSTERGETNLAACPKDKIAKK